MAPRRRALRQVTHAPRPPPDTSPAPPLPPRYSAHLVPSRQFGFPQLDQLLKVSRHDLLRRGGRERDGHLLAPVLILLLPRNIPTRRFALRVIAGLQRPACFVKQLPAREGGSGSAATHLPRIQPPTNQGANLPDRQTDRQPNKQPDGTHRSLNI